MTVFVLWPDGSEISGVTPTHLLTKMMGGWNPNTSIYHLRKKLASRAGFVDDPEQNDMEFLYRMDAVGAWTVGFSDSSTVSPFRS